MSDNIFRLYSDLPDFCAAKVWAEIDTDAIRYNYRALRAHVHSKSPDCTVACVVKADAYGHSAEICVPALIKEGCNMFCVSSSSEAVAVRKIADKAGSHPDILVLGYTIPDDASMLVDYDIIQAVFSLDYARSLNEKVQGGQVKIHIKLDTGMNRIGFPCHSDEEIKASVEEIKAVSGLDRLNIDGAFAHFARADESGEDGIARTRTQAERFKKATDAIIASGIPLRMRHTCNSAGAIVYPEFYFDGCRLGISLYGANPSDEVGFEVKPVMNLKTVVSFVHTLKKGEAVSYGGTFAADRDMTIATLPVGYADGFIRAFTGATVIISRRDSDEAVRAKIIGRICMDQCMIDVTGKDVRVGDEVTLIGGEGQIDDLASRAKTINYECFCGISARVPRVPKKTV